MIKDYTKPNDCYCNVLSSIPNIAEKNPRIVDLALLGSHDSFTHLISKKSLTADNAPKFVRLINNTLLKNISVRYSKTQLVGAYEQLMAGVRYFDVRLHYANSTFMTKHSLISGMFAEFITEILKFLDENKGEVVVFRFYNWKYRDKGQPYLINFLKSVSYKGKTLLDYIYYKTRDAGHFDTAGLTDTPYAAKKLDIPNNYDKEKGIYLTDLTYNDVTKNGKESGIVMYGWERKDNENIPDCFYADGYEKARWLHTSDIKDAFGKMDKEVIEMAVYYEGITRHMFRVNQANLCLSTKSLKQILCALKGRSLINMANRFNPEFVEHKNFDVWLRAMPCVWVDYATCNTGDFNNKINKKIIEYNKKLCSK